MDQIKLKKSDFTFKINQKSFNFSGMNIATFRKLTRLDLTIFGLPFLFSGVVLGFLSKGSFIFKLSDLWILSAFFFARISGMAFNQLIDKKFDIENPRTKDRPVASGKVKEREALVIALSSLFLFILSSLMLSFPLFLFSVVVAALLVLYSFCKRFTALSHFVLGLIHFFSPVLAYFAISSQITVPAIFLGFSSFCLLSGSDIIYSFMDIEFDRKLQLHSLPAIIGIKAARRVSEILHTLAVLSLFGVGLFSDLNPLFYLSALIALVIFICFHIQVKKLVKKHENLLELHGLFFSINVTVACLILLFLIIGTI